MPALLLTAAGHAANAADYVASTRAAAILRAAPMVSSVQLGTVPAGTTLQVIACFDEGTYCKVEGKGIIGFVTGQLLFVEGTDQSVIAAEQKRWTNIRSSPSYWDGALDKILRGAAAIGAPSP